MPKCPSKVKNYSRNGPNVRETKYLVDNDAKISSKWAKSCRIWKNAKFRKMVGNCPKENDEICRKWIRTKHWPKCKIKAHTITRRDYEGGVGETPYVWGMANLANSNILRPNATSSSSARNVFRDDVFLIRVEGVFNVGFLYKNQRSLMGMDGIGTMHPSGWVGGHFGWAGDFLISTF